MTITSNKSDCTGCGACNSICPIHCITMKQDAEGFLYPNIDDRDCTNCEKCKEICPSIVQGCVLKPLNVYAAKNSDEEIRYASSSGGIFSLLAEYVIKEGGIVFGARFNDDWEVIHDYTETIEGLAAFRGSKYVQSVTGSTYRQTKYFLEIGRKVLYCGTPCQVAGLKAFLQMDYDNLLAIDFVCHGVPSPLVWKKYLDEIVKTMSIKNILSINFRNKNYGWRHFNLAITYSDETRKNVLFYQNLNANSFFRGFLQNLYLRPSCHNCPVKPLKSGSEITIADYWGIWDVLPDFDDNKGVSLVMVNTEKGGKVYGLLDKVEHETKYTDALIVNSAIEKSVLPHKKRVLFFLKWYNEPLIPLINKMLAVSFRVRLRKLTGVFLRRFGLLIFVKSYLKKRNHG